MACTPGVELPFPELPAPFSIAPPAPPEVEFAADLCCKLLQFVPPIPPIPLPPLTVNPATAALLTSSLATIQAYLDSLPIKCPRE